MLILTLKEGDQVRVGEGPDQVIVKFTLGVRGQIRLGFAAPEHMPVLRESVYQRMRAGGPRRAVRGRR